MFAALIASAKEALSGDAALPDLLTGSVNVLDRDLRYVVAKGQILSRLGLAPDILLGRRPADIFPRRVAQAGEPLYARAISGEGVAFELSWSDQFLEPRATPAERDGIRVSTVLVSAEDLTAQRRAVTRLRFQAEAGAILGMSLDIDTTLSAIADLTVTHLADFCAVHVLNDEGQLRRIALAHADPSHADLARGLVDGYELRTGIAHGPARVLESGRTELLEDIRDEILVANAKDERQLELLREMNLASSLIVPMLVEGRVVGALTLAVSRPNASFTDADRALAEDLATRMAFAVENARMYRSVQQERDRLKAASEANRLRSEALDRLTESAAIAIAVIEGETIAEANDAFARLVGCDPTDLRSGELRWWDMSPVAYRSLEVQSLDEMIVTGRSTPYEKEFLRRDGSRVPVLQGAALIEREPLKWVCFAVDLSSRHDLERAHATFSRELGTDLTHPIAVTRWASHVMGRSTWIGREESGYQRDRADGVRTGNDATVSMVQAIEESAFGRGPGIGERPVVRERVRRFGKGKRRRLPTLG